MKTTTRNVLIGLMAGGAMLMAGNVGTLTQFHPNTPAKSAEVNANFAAVKTAVNGNASDIASNKSAIQTNTTNIALKQHNITGNCAEGSAIRQVNSDGTVLCETVDKSGSIVVQGFAFQSGDETTDKCKLIRFLDIAVSSPAMYFSPSSSSDSCKAYAPVSIPKYAHITGMTCRVKHQYSGHVSIMLYEQYRPFNIANGKHEDVRYRYIYSADLSNTSSDDQIIAATATPGTSENTLEYKAYFIRWSPPATDTSGANERIYDCRVDYAF